MPLSSGTRDTLGIAATLLIPCGYLFFRCVLPVLLHLSEAQETQWASAVNWGWGILLFVCMAIVLAVLRTTPSD
jgi:hypothetical protein